MKNFLLRNFFVHSLTFFFAISVFYSFAYADDGEVELAAYMGELQRFSHKLGFSIQGKNKELSEFYLHEVKEVLGELEEVNEHDGVLIGSSVQTIMSPVVKELSEFIRNSKWQESRTSYEKVINSCNSCHLATGYGFIKILPSSGEAPYNQEFK